MPHDDIPNMFGRGMLNFTASSEFSFDAENFGYPFSLFFMSIALLNYGSTLSYWHKIHNCSHLQYILTLCRSSYESVDFSVLSGTKYGLKQTRGKFGLGAKMVGFNISLETV